MNRQYRVGLDIRHDQETDTWVCALKDVKWGPVVSAPTRVEVLIKVRKVMPMACMLQSIASGKFVMITSMEDSAVIIMTNDEMMVGELLLPTPSEN